MSESTEYIHEKLIELQMKALTWLEKISDQDCADIDVEELGEVTDVVKDLFEADLYLQKSNYYSFKMEGMEEEESKSAMTTMRHMSV